jgi:hypothetical protein
VVESTRNQGHWREGDTLWGIEGQQLFFEDGRVLPPQFLLDSSAHFVCLRYDVIDYIYAEHLSPVRLMETRNRRRLEAFVEQRSYVREQGDPEH